MNKSNCLTQVQWHNNHEKHVDIEHNVLIKAYDLERTNYPLNGQMDHEPPKKKTIISPITISRFFVIFNLFKKDHETQIGFLKNVMLFFIKRFSPMKIMEFIWL
jgi:hypothetical protein